MSEQSVNMMKETMDHNLVDFHIINSAIPLKTAIKYCHEIKFGNPGQMYYITNVEIVKHEPIFFQVQAHSIIAAAHKAIAGVLRK